MKKIFQHKILGPFKKAHFFFVNSTKTITEEQTYYAYNYIAECRYIHNNNMKNKYILFGIVYNIRHVRAHYVQITNFTMHMYGRERKRHTMLLSHKTRTAPPSL